MKGVRVATADVSAEESVEVSVEEADVDTFVVSGDGGVGLVGGEDSAVVEGAFGHEDLGGGVVDGDELCGLRGEPGAEAHVHRVREGGGFVGGVGGGAAPGGFAEGGDGGAAWIVSHRPGMFMKGGGR